MIRRISLISFVLLIVLCIHGQSPYSLSKQFTIEDGLPSNECHGIVQDSLGYIWIATDRGLSRFDGYGFKNYGIQHGLAELSCLDIKMDDHGDLWMQTYSNSFYKYLHKEDTIVAYAYNTKLEDELDELSILDFAIHSDTLYVAHKDHGYIKIDKKGDLISYSPLKNEFYIAFLELNHDLFCYNYSGNNTNTNRNYYDSGYSTAQYLIYISGVFFDTRFRSDLDKFSIQKAFKTPENNALYYSNGYIYECNNDTIIDIFESDGMHDLLFLSDGAILTGQLEGGGLKYYKSLAALKQNLGETIYSGISVSDIDLDQDRNIVVSTLEDGLLLFKKPEIIPLQDPLINGQNIINIQGISTAHLFINVNMEDVIKFNLQHNEIVNVEKNISKKLFHVYLNNRTGDRIYSAYPVSYFYFKDKIEILKEEYGFKHQIKAKNTRSIQNHKSLVLSQKGIQIFNDNESYPSYTSYPQFVKLNAIDAIDYRDGYLIGGKDGLYYLEDDVKVKLDSIHPFFSYRINSIERIDTIYYLGSIGGGLAIWDGHHDVAVINEEDGLISNNIEKVVTDSLNKIVLCTKYGMSRLSLEDSIQIDNYTMSHGLPANQVNDAMFFNDTLIIATSKGLAYMPPLAIQYASPRQPLVESIIVNSKESNLLDSLELVYYENAIAITYKALDYTQVNPIRYRYKLNESAWSVTKDIEVNFAALQPGDYQFQVSASNKDGEWSSPAYVTFKISPPLWRTKLFLMSLALCIAFAIYSIYRRRLKVIQDKTTLEKEILKLERSALQAQMNPHFIFNCLNSIQSFIISNESELAMDYLSKFAKLIRQNLNASYTNKVSLDQEIRMLDNYLALEQLRCNHVFTYSISVAENIDPIAIEFPPLLVQPYAENAIIHGMKYMKSGGKINITFNIEDTNLQIKVSDNGPGMLTTKVKKQSIGMQLTERRLALNNSIAQDNYTVKISSNEHGTEVNLFIKLVQPY